MAGRYFDQWAVGDRIVHEIRRTVTETDNLLFSTMTHNPQPLHLDAEAAKASEFGQILVNGTFTVHPKPVFIGDTMRAETEVAELKSSRSRPNAGIVTFMHQLINQRDEIVCQCLRSALLLRTPA
jgi:acyl dehydratase